MEIGNFTHLDITIFAIFDYIEYFNSVLNNQYRDNTVESFTFDISIHSYTAVQQASINRIFLFISIIVTLLDFFLVALNFCT